MSSREGGSVAQPTPPGRVAVIGAGRMGSGIAHAFLSRGSEVTLRDVSADPLDLGRRRVEQAAEEAAKRGTLGATVAETLKRLDTHPSLGGLDGCDLVIEAVPERPELKEAVLAELSSEASADAVLASNTSSISLTRLAGSVMGPERFLGLHFFNPVPASRMVEIVRAADTSQEHIDLATAWVMAIGKRPIVVADSPGFATSRLGVVIGLEAIRMLEDGVASAEDIDDGMVLGYGFPIGPLHLTDIVGLDVRLEIARYLQTTLGERFAPPALLEQKVALGELGRKSGRGFYNWSEESGRERTPARKESA